MGYLFDGYCHADEASLLAHHNSKPPYPGGDGSLWFHWGAEISGAYVRQTFERCTPSGCSDDVQLLMGYGACDVEGPAFESWEQSYVQSQGESYWTAKWAALGVDSAGIGSAFAWAFGVVVFFWFLGYITGVGKKGVEKA